MKASVNRLTDQFHPPDPKTDHAIPAQPKQCFYVVPLAFIFRCLSAARQRSNVRLGLRRCQIQMTDQCECDHFDCLVPSFFFLPGSPFSFFPRPFPPFSPRLPPFLSSFPDRPPLASPPPPAIPVCLPCHSQIRRRQNQTFVPANTAIAATAGAEDGANF